MKTKKLVCTLFVLLIGNLVYGLSYSSPTKVASRITVDSSMVVRYNFKDRLAYHIYSNGDTSIILYTQDDSAPVMTSQYKEGFGKDYLSFLSMEYKHGNTVYEVDGRMMNGDYLSFNSYKEKDTSLDNQPNYYKISEVLWEVGVYNDCKMYYHEEENNTQIRVFVYNRKDGVDYNSACKALLRTHGLRTLILEPGWLVITADFFVDQDTQYELIGQLMSDTTDFKQTITINKRELELLFDSTPEEYREFIGTTPHPNYCEVIGWSQTLDEKTSDYVVEFLGDMCTYFNLYGRYDLKEFQAYFLRAARYRKEHYIKHQMLSKKQANLFYKELLEHESSNLKENLIDF
ncbi:hypothetical protein [Sphingobacterium paucimobilis]|uniref:Uncharacterized protein n=1 Tax=Sphingobacterium paucimobilis HER1398 TaxID=1346330 RepID=U2HYL4_9SPHI|nr:hypothetical protein [Sphingobacterium paucimobilis]ERJ60360.1 hypothetical protein M472_16530 [Sphingobacterium paucimobilis HER1398]